jgi:hypothetical protein
MLRRSIRNARSSLESDILLHHSHAPPVIVGLRMPPGIVRGTDFDDSQIGRGDLLKRQKLLLWFSFDHGTVDDLPFLELDGKLGNL